MPALADSLISYGPYVFPANTETTALSVVPEYDRAGRTAIYNRIRITLRAVLAGTVIDPEVRAVVQLLSKPAYQFVYAGSGYGLGVNIGSIRDVVWGPKPTEATVKPLGGGNAVELTWTVEVAIPDGPGARYKFAPMEYGYTLAYAIDRSGYTTRTYSGYLRIPMTRKSPADRTLPDNVDSYREDVYPPLLLGFRRTPGTWEINAAKDEISFSCTDEQMGPAALWPGIIECSAEHHVSCPPKQFQIWNHTISGTYEVARNGTATVADARNGFFALVGDRIKFLRNQLANRDSELVAGGGARPSGPSITPASFSMSEPNIYGRTIAKFSMSYVVVGPSLPAMLQASGQWRLPPGGLDWKRWQDSVGPTVMSARGHAGLTFSANDDQIVDLYQPVPDFLDLSSNIGGVSGGLSAIPRDVFPEPTPDSSWIHYENHVYFESDSGVSEVRTLPTDERTAPGDLYGSTGSNPAGGIALGVIQGAYNYLTAKDPFFFPPPRKPEQQKKGGLATPQRPQRRARQGGAIYLIGKAVRVRYAIPAPSLNKWGKATLTPANRPDRGEGFWTGVVGNALYPVTAARWRLRWLVDAPPSDTPPVVPNPLYGGGGEAAANSNGNAGDVLAGVGRK